MFAYAARCSNALFDKPPLSAGLNFRLQSMGSTTTVVAFIIMPAATHSYTIDALKGQAVTKQLRDTVTDIQNRIGNRLFEHAARYNDSKPETGSLVPDLAELLTEEDRVLLKRRIFALKRNSLPPVTTHNMTDDGSDPILNQIRRVQLFNRDTDRVKVIFHPDFLNANNPILGLDYEEFVRGCHMGVFPSYYEPWGYTPAECTVVSADSVTILVTPTHNQDHCRWAFLPSLQISLGSARSCRI